MEVAAPSGEEESVALDADLIKVLAADSRRDILRLLGERRMTLTELSQRLGLGKATVLEHLKRLVEADLVRRHEDERLWVYYDLTRKGTRFVHPGRTRFHLLLAAGVLALVMGVALAAALMGGEPPAESPAAADPLQVQLDGARSTEDGLFAVKARVSAASGDVQAFLVDADAAGQVGRSGAPVVGVPLAVADATAPSYEAPSSGGSTDDATGDTAAPHPTEPTPAPTTAPTTVDGRVEKPVATLSLDLRTAAALPPGAYYVVVVDSAGRPALSDAPALVVPEVSAQLSRAVAWRGVDERVDVTLTGPGTSAEVGVLAFTLADEARTILTLPVEAGVARLDAAQLDALQPGRYALTFHGEDKTPAVRLRQAFEVSDPRVMLSQHVVAAQANSTLRLTVQGPAPGTLVPVLLDGEPVLNASAGETLPLALPPLAIGPHTVTVGRVANLTLDARPQAVASPSLDGATWTVADTQGRPLARAPVSIDGEGAGQTDANGTFTFSSVPADEFVVQVGEGDATVTSFALARNGSIIPLANRLEHRLLGAGGASMGELAFRVEVANVQPLAVRGTLHVWVDGAPLDARLLEVPAGENVTLDLSYENAASGQRLVQVQARAFDEVVRAPYPPAVTSGMDDSTPPDTSSPRSDWSYDAFLDVDGEPGLRVVVQEPPPAAYSMLPGARVLPVAPSASAMDAPAAVPLPPFAVVLAVVALAAWLGRRGGRGPPTGPYR